jgi:Helicase associated domain
VLTPSRIHRLTDLGFVLSMTEKNPYRKFSEWLQVLKAFKEENGHCRVPHDYPPDTVFRHGCTVNATNIANIKEQLKLGDDVLAARPYRSKYEAKSTLTPERIATLNELGFLWQVAKRTGSFSEPTAKVGM